MKSIDTTITCILLSILGLRLCLAMSQSPVTQQGISSPLCWHHHCPHNLSSPSVLVKHDLFILSDNKQTKFADWVAYVVDKKNCHGPKRKRVWRTDPKLPPTVALVPKDFSGAYKNYHYDRGHQAPLASFSNNPQWESTNYLSNITPQKAALNRGAWLKLESAVRKLAEHRQVYVVTGTLYAGEPMPALPKAHVAHQVPTAYWKVVLYEGSDHQTGCVTAFVLPQNLARRADFCQRRVTMGALNQKIGYAVLPQSQYQPMGAAGCPVKLCG